MEPIIGSTELGGGVLESLLARSADVTLLIHAPTGTLLHRWYDPEHSRLPLPAEPKQRVIDWIHPDDLPAVLEVLAGAAHDGVARTTVARIRLEEVDDEVERSLMITAHEAGGIVEDSMLIQAWAIDFSGTVDQEVDPAAAVSSLAEAAPVGLQVRSANGTVSFENVRFTELADGERDRVDERVRKALGGTGEWIEDLEVGDCSLRLRVVPTHNDEGHLTIAVASLEDVTSLRRAEAGRAAAQGLFRAVFDGSPVATAIVDLDGRFTQVNEALAMICGYSVDDLIGRTFAELTHPDDLAIDQELLAEVLEGTRGGYQMEKRYLHRAGHEVWVELTVSTVRDPAGAITHLVSHVADITTRKAVLGTVESTGDLAYWATRDHLTGLPNRRYLDNYLASTFGHRRRADDRVVVLFLDLDDFKPVNDEHGHLVGDEVLRTIARRLRNTCREDELVARYGGDEFVVVTRKLRTAYDVSLLSERILSAVRTPITGLTAEPVCVGASVGIAIATDDDGSEDLLARADATSYRAKRAGKGQARYDEPR